MVNFLGETRKINDKNIISATLESYIRYVILYKYVDKRGKEAAFIYFWQGLKSTQVLRSTFT